MQRTRTTAPSMVEDRATAEAYLEDMDHFTALRAEQEEESFVRLSGVPESSGVRSEAVCE